MFLTKRAPEIISKKEQWLNSEPLTPEKLKGKIVLLDFWTYSCINCLRTLPALKEMWEKYKSKNFIIIGIHTPEFEFEKEIENVKAAVKKHRIEYPVLNDPERINWNRYGNKYWPRYALINPRGNLILEHIGESGYDEIDERIAGELGNKGERIWEKKRIYPAGISPEIYAGSLRNPGLGSGEACTKEGCQYVDPGNHIRDVIYISGNWNQEPGFLVFEGKEGHISFRYYASEVNLVMEGKGIAEVLLDEKPLKKEDAGADIELKNGKSYVIIDRSDMYNIIKSRNFKMGEIKLIPFKGLRVYAYTFG